MERPRLLWQIAEGDPDRETALAEGLGISRITARILVNRGIKTIEEAKAFLDADLKLHDPFLLKGMGVAVERILDAIERGEKIIIYGDYDADGVTATALLLDALSALGCEAGFYIPDRLEDGYGLNREALDRILTQGYRLVITVDCGISAKEEALYARGLGLDLIITDHHEPPAELPHAYALINPKQPGCNYPFKDLAGVGVAFKLATALFARRPETAGPEREIELMDLVTLGSVADMVPLTGENRVLVKYGLDILSRTRREGIRCLLEIADIKGPVGPGQVGFALAPRINATGRVGDASIAVRLLRTDDLVRARDMAVYLDSENRARQEIEASVLAEALEMLEEFDPGRDKFILLVRANWHPGVIGIVASRLVERFYRPVILLALEGEEAKGSGRSIPGFNLYQALESCSQLLTRFGGHKQAAGLALRVDVIEQLRSELNRLAGLEPEELFVPKLSVDARVDLEEINSGLVSELKSLEPHGIGNPSPLLASFGLSPLGAGTVGRDKDHLKLKLKGSAATLDAIGFRLAYLLESLGPSVEAAYFPELNEFRGFTSVQLRLRDIRLSSTAARGEPEYFTKLSERERGILRAVSQRNASCNFDGESTVFPLLAALHQASSTGLPSLLVYPLRAFADRMARTAITLVEEYSVGVQVQFLSKSGEPTPEPAAAIPSTAAIPPAALFTSFEFLAEHLARLDGTRLGLIVADCFPPGRLERQGAPILYTSTSLSLLKIYAPNREQLAGLYRTIKELIPPQGSLDSELCHKAAEHVNESEDFVRSGLEIFEELSIIKRKNNGLKRIIHFQAPVGRLELTESAKFVQGQIIRQQFAKLTNSFPA